MADLKKSPYAPWLEGLVRHILESQPAGIAVVMLQGEDPYVETAYYKMNATDKTIAAHNIYTDAIWDVIENNRDKLRELIEGDGDDE